MPEASEIGTPILYITAIHSIDDDTGSNANLRYSIPDLSIAPYFAVNETTAEIYISGQSPDFETMNVCLALIRMSTIHFRETALPVS